MLVETGVLRGDRRLDQAQGQFVIPHERTVFNMVGRQDLPFLRDDLGGQLAVRVLQLLDGRDLSEHPDQSQQDGEGDKRRNEQEPEPLRDFLSCRIRHKQLSSEKKSLRHKTKGLAKSSKYKINQKIWKIARNLAYFAK